ncbi:MAG: hydantoinase/oxoprolinase family protein, partial [Pseudomonadota bacterium]
LALDGTMSAYGICETVDENMANAARVHAVENGEDLSTYTMIAFGGAAPLHAGRLCEKLGIDRLLVPPGAGVGSAIGFLRAPFSFEATHSHFMKLSGFDRSTVRTILTDLEAEAAGFVRSCNVDTDILADAKVYMRYAGQGSEIPVVLPPGFADNPDGKLLTRLFEDAYRALFGRTVDGMEIVITVWAVNATTPPEQVNPIEAFNTGSALDVHTKNRLFDPTLVETVEATSALRDKFGTGTMLAGPATITERETTIIVPSSMTSIMQADGCIDLRSKPEEASA